MKVKKLELNNFRGIRKMEIVFSERINVLVGVNGVGKSSVLNAIAILLSRLIRRIRSNRSTGRQFSIDDVMVGEGETRNTIKVEVAGKEIEWRVGKSRSTYKKQTITNLESLNSFVNWIHGELEKELEYNLPLAVYYSVNRAVLDVPLRIRKTHIFEPLAAYDDALNEKRNENDFRLFFEWFRNREDLENENRRYMESSFKPDKWEYPDRQLKAIRKALSILMPDFSELQVRRQHLRMVVNKKGTVFEINHLSDGEKCLLAMVGDMARRLALANPSLENPLYGEGVVMIDEVDLHLHPAWQRMVLPKLCEAFPNCQFIVSTHSPQILNHLKPENIFLFKERDGDIIYSKPNASYGRESGDLLEDLMDVPERPDSVEEDIHKLFILIDEDRIQEAKELLTVLNREVLDDPELQKADVVIQRMERLRK